MKLKPSLVAAAACAALASPAFALDAATTLAIPDTNRLTMSGSSALQFVIEGLLNQPGNCVAGTFTRFRGLLGSPAAGGSDTSNGQSYNLYSCTLGAASDFPAFNGQNIMINKREAGGSANGVFPLLAGAAPIGLIDPASCTDGPTNANTCNALANVVPKAGVSDLEPLAFTNIANQPTSFYVAGAPQQLPAAPFRASTSVAEQVFGLAVNDTLYAALAAAQGTPTPSVPAAAFASVFATGYNATNLGWLPFGKTLANAGNQVNVCSRAIGSGTRATAQIEFLQLPYNSFAPAVALPAENTPGATRGGNTAGAKFYSEESSSGNVVGCLNAANASSGYAIGILGVDRDLSGTGAQFIRLDGQEPTKAVAKEGLYSWVFESFYQTNKNNVGTSPNELATQFGVAFRRPANINAVSGPAANGLMATPVNCSGVTANDWVLPEEIASCSRVSRNRDSRLPLRFVK